MAYRVETSRRAERDIEEAFEYIYSRSPINAIRWREGLERRLLSLQQEGIADWKQKAVKSVWMSGLGSGFFFSCNGGPSIHGVHDASA
jgi:acetyltransferase-like isoleucine patch superfamily enzyme